MARSPLQGDRVRRRARVPRGVHEHAAVPDLRWRAAQEGKPVRALQRQVDFGSDRDVDQAGARVLRRAQAERAGSRNRPPHSEGNSRAPEFSRRRRPRVPDARSPVGQPLRRRGPTHPSRHANRIEPRRRALHPRRAVDRTSSARQSAAARDAQAPQGTRQHRAGGRARSRDDARSRSSDRHGPGRRNSRRLRRLAGHSRRSDARRELAHRQISFGRSRDSGAVAAPQALRPMADRQGRAREQSARSHRRDSARRLHLHHRRFRFRQIDARARHRSIARSRRN